MEGAVGRRGAGVRKRSGRVIYGQRQKMDCCFWVSACASVSNMGIKKKYTLVLK